VFLALWRCVEEKVRRSRSNSALLAIVLLAPLVAVACGTTYSSTPPETPRADLEGYRYERMRVLSGRLVDRLQATRDELRATRNREADTPLFADLLDRARRFRDRMENAADPPRYVRADVGEIDRLAREYDAQTRRISASTRAVGSWAAAQDVVNRMERLVSGGDVDLPPEGDAYPYPPNPPYPSTPTLPTDPSYGSVLSGSALEDVRRMAHELVVRATLARDNAERAGTPYGDSDRRLLADLSYFVSGAKELETRTSSASGVDRRDVRPFVDRLGEDARRLDASLRGSPAFSRAGGDWDEVIRLLQSLSDATR
jgi:hypothetical protein